MCPVRESDWIHDWHPKLVVSESGLVENDCAFITPGDGVDAIWYVTRFEPEYHFVEMIKITPGVTACRLTIAMNESENGTDATITYTHTSIGPQGDAFVDEFTEEYFRRFMDEWENMVEYYLQHGKPLLP